MPPKVKDTIVAFLEMMKHERLCFKLLDGTDREILGQDLLFSFGRTVYGMSANPTIAQGIFQDLSNYSIAAGLTLHHFIASVATVSAKIWP